MTVDIAGRLRRQGYRVTPQRMLVLEVLAGEGRHMSAEEIYGEVARRFPFINLSTVYRTLEMLSAEGIVRRAHLGADRRVYELAHEGDHHHLVCKRCGAVQHIAAAHLDNLESHLEGEHGFEVQESILTSFGVCARCRGG